MIVRRSGCSTPRTGWRYRAAASRTEPASAFRRTRPPDRQQAAGRRLRGSRVRPRGARARSTTFIAHIRYASTGADALENTHPFEQQGRLLAHNGVIGDLDRLDRELGDHRALVQGDTDSERFFALVTRRIEQHAGDITAGLTSAARFVAKELPLYALNIVLVTPSELWALRYPDTHDLLFLERKPEGHRGHLDHASAAGTVRVRSADAARHPVIVVASEPMDEDPHWRALGSGELLHVDGHLATTVERVLEQPPAHRLTLADLDARAAASQKRPAPVATSPDVHS